MMSWKTRFVFWEWIEWSCVLFGIAFIVNRYDIIFILRGFTDVSCIFTKSILIVNTLLILKNCVLVDGRAPLVKTRTVVLKLLPYHIIESLYVTLDGI